VLLVYNTDVNVCQPKIKKCHYNGTHSSLSLSPPPANKASAMAEIVLKNPQKSIREFDETSEPISLRAAADTLQVHVAVARIVKPSKKLGCLEFYTL
jgi:hypothetical protein